MIKFLLSRHVANKASETDFGGGGAAQSPADAKLDATSALDGIFGEEFDGGFEGADDPEPTPEPEPKPKAKETEKPKPKPDKREESDPLEDDALESLTAEEEGETSAAVEGEEDDEAAEAAEDQEALNGARDKARTQAILDSRARKLAKARADRDAAGVRAEALEKELTEAKSKQVAQPPLLLKPTQANPLSNVHTVEQLQQTEAAWQAELDWCEANAEGGNRKGKDGALDEWDAARVSERAKQARYMLRHVAAREKWVEEQGQDAEAALKLMPFLADDKDPMHAQALTWAQGLQKNDPALFAAVAASPRQDSLYGKLFLMELILKGTHTLIRRKDGSIQPVAINRPADGGNKPKPAAVPAPKPAGAKAPAAVPGGPPPSRPAGAKRTDADLLAMEDPRDAARQAMEELFE